MQWMVLLRTVIWTERYQTYTNYICLYNNGVPARDEGFHLYITPYKLHYVRKGGFGHIGISFQGVTKAEASNVVEGFTGYNKLI